MPKKKIRQILVEGNVAYVPLTKGFHSIIDASDMHLVDGYNWHVIANPKTGTMYAARTCRASGRERKVWMHRVVARSSGDFEVDHKNRDGLDNRRDNLRVATPSQNMCNRRLQRNNNSGIRGVSYEKKRGKWSARISFNGKKKNLGYYDTADQAGEAYAAAAKELHGEFSGQMS